MYLPILYLSRVELRCKLQEKLHSVSGPLNNYPFLLYAARPCEHFKLKAVFQLRVFHTYVHARKTLIPFQYYI